MEGNKEVGSRSSSSSFTSELFGSKDSPSSSSGIFGSIFAPPAKVFGRESLRPDAMANRQDTPKEARSSKPVAPGDTTKKREGESQSKIDTDMSSIYADQRSEPCHLSSSIFYGGQDIYCQPQTSQSSLYKNDSGEDDSECASRGNWWQGSLYY